MKRLVDMTAIFIWVAGMVIAKGLWSTFFAIIVAPYAWYLVIEKMIQMAGSGY